MLQQHMMFNSKEMLIMPPGPSTVFRLADLKRVLVYTGVLNHLKHSFNDLRLSSSYIARSEPRLHAASVSSASMATLAAAETARAAAGSGGSGLLGTSLLVVETPMANIVWISILQSE